MLLAVSPRMEREQSQRGVVSQRHTAGAASASADLSRVLNALVAIRWDITRAIVRLVVATMERILALDMAGDVKERATIRRQQGRRGVEARRRQLL